MEKVLNIFVYGTLKRGERNFYVLQDGKNGSAKFQAEGNTKEKFPLVVEDPVVNIPFLLNRPGTGLNISGEIFTIDANMLKTLDAFEQYPVWYDRQLHDIVAGSETKQCWIYLLKNFSEDFLKLPLLSEFKEKNT